MKRFMMIAVFAESMLMTGASTAKADHYYGRSRSNFGISISYGNGFNNFGGAYGRGYGYGVPYGGYGGGFGGYRGAYQRFNAYPTYAVPVYAVPVYRGGYGGYPGYGRHCR